MENHRPWKQAGQILPPSPQQPNDAHYEYERQRQHQFQQLQPQQQQPQQPQQQHVPIQAKGHTLSKVSTKSAQALKSSKSSTPSDIPSFTFIDHDDDLTSKRIKDKKARKAIRSHVMRDVRRRERLAGLKRTSKRGATKDKASPPSADQDSTETTCSTKDRRKAIASANATDADMKKDIDNNSISDRTTMSPSPISTSELSMISRSPSGEGTSIASLILEQDRSDFPSFPSPLGDTTSWAFDPFSTLPGASPSTNDVIDGLIKYFSAVLIPMTFPAETRQPQDSKNRMALIISATISEPGPFFGYMSLCAAHRAVLQGKHSELVATAPTGAGKERVLFEPDYYMMKARCIREMNRKLQDPVLALTDSAFDIVVSLTSCALTIGDFDEARDHIQGLKQMVDLRGGVFGPSFQGEGVRLLSNVLICDIMSASALMSRPLFPLTWDPQPIPPETKERIIPPHTSPLSNIGMALCTNEALSNPLQKALMGLREILFFEHANTRDPENFSALENEIFLFKSHEVEFELLDYPFRLARNSTSATSETTPQSPISLQPIENVARVAAICHINNFFIVSPPSSGLGRALSRHLAMALSRFPTAAFPRLPNAWLNLITWAAFLGARGSKGQKAKPWFLQRLREVAEVRGWIQSGSLSGSRWDEDDGNGEDGNGEDGWAAVEEALKGYLYIPELHGGVFRSIWQDVVEGPVVVEVG
ncbi:tachykinin family protein [Histoplasma capsulatum]|uniref:Tachykinin family protein n=1 Tax=Ajellomyces capsulatus TaxID=5037 RepID=A0A8A1MLY9_AJECA|nr:predicted protein [Histoplasma mississippiense (nom. inval.)]EDN11237.1 predicted protein [Histoplasma mississippiense (nom. inval.)]QSS66845.1 tachykinin family protein [Histoplasma capsulatum]